MCDVCFYFLEDTLQAEFALRALNHIGTAKKKEFTVARNIIALLVSA